MTAAICWRFSQAQSTFTQATEDADLQGFKRGNVEHSHRLMTPKSTTFNERSEFPALNVQAYSLLQILTSFGSIILAGWLEVHWARMQNP
jgi:hypothetical protein